jgi:hypothetical protein
MFVFGSARQEAMYLRVRRMRQQLLGVTTGYHGPCLRIEKDAVIRDGENAWKFVRNYHYRRPESVTQFQDQIVKQARAYRVEAS